MPDNKKRSEEEDIQETPIDDAADEAADDDEGEGSEAPVAEQRERRRDPRDLKRSDASRKIAWISNGLMIVGILLLLGAVGVHIMLQGTARVMWVRIVAGAAGVMFLGAMAVGYRDLIRWLKGRATQEGLISLAFTVAVLAIVVFGVYLGQRYSEQWDLTEDRIYSLSEKSLNVIEGLDQEVQIITALRSSSRAQQTQTIQRVRDLIALYEDEGRGRISVENLNPDRHFEEMRELGVDASDVVIVKAGEGSGESQTLQLFDASSEQKITSAIMSVSRDTKPTVYFVEGYGQYSISETGDLGLSTFKGMLEEDLYQVKSLNLVTEQGEIPDDAQVLVIAGGNQPFAEGHQRAIADWVDSGGRLLLLAPNRVIDPEGDAPDFAAVLDGWGIHVRADVVIDPESGSFLSYVPIVSGSGIGDHPITEPFRTRSASIPFDPMMTCSLRVDAAPEVPGQPAPPGQPTWLLRTHNMAYGKASIETTAAQEPGDTPGPLTLAACASRTVGAAPMGEDDAPQETAKVVVIGDERFAVNGRIQLYGGQSERTPCWAFARNCIHWLAESDDLIAIPPKSDTPETITPTKSQMAWSRLFTILSALIPLVIGTIIWFVRRG